LLSPPLVHFLIRAAIQQIDRWDFPSTVANLTALSHSMI
jgi:hypothetical protein